MTEVKTAPKYTYYFFQQPDDRWMAWDQFGSDRLVDVQTVNEHIVPHLQRSGTSVLNADIYQIDKVRLEITGFGQVEAMVRLYVKDGVITKVHLLTVDGDTIRTNIRQFELQLPHFEGTPWPYTESEMSEMVEASR